MPYNNLPPNWWDIIITFLLSIISGAVSISRRILMGQTSSWLWIISEFLTAILCGYLMYSAYPYLTDHLPAWFTLPVAVAIAAHSGGRLFQEVEATVLDRLDNILTKPD